MIAKANVKINLGLRVLRKREDGFHDLDTLFLPFAGVYDNLEVIKSDDYSRLSTQLFEKYNGVDFPQPVQAITEDGKVMISIAGEQVIDWNPLDDLCVKAYYLLAQDFKLTSIKIFLEKKSPVGAGLGGGSSDAAFTLKLLNEIFELHLSDNELVAYASKLGSDCAFFIHNKPMFGEGRGDILTECSTEILEMNRAKDSIKVGEQLYKIEIHSPQNIKVSTKQAYSFIIPCDKGDCITKLLAEPIETWQDKVKNDFETSVFKHYPELLEYKKELLSTNAVYVSMSGSGSSFLSLTRQEKLK